MMIGWRIETKKNNKIKLWDRDEGAVATEQFSRVLCSFHRRNGCHRRSDRNSRYHVGPEQLRPSGRHVRVAPQLAQLEHLKMESNLVWLRDFQIFHSFFFQNLTVLQNFLKVNFKVLVQFLTDLVKNLKVNF